MQQNTNHKTQFMISITPTYFGIGVPSSESLRTKSITSVGLVSLRAHGITSRLVVLCVRRLPEDGSLVPKHARMISIMNKVLWFAFYFILFYFILFYFILFYFILFYFLFYFILFYFVLFYFILFYFILFYFILFYFILFYFILFYFYFYFFVNILKFLNHC